MERQERRKPWQDIHKGAYSGDDAAEDFYNSRRTDGGRPALYSRLFYGDIREAERIVSIGCGKADTELKILKKTALDRGSIQFTGYDVARSMLEAAEREFADSPWRRRFDVRDVFTDSFVDSEIQNALQSRTLFLAIGRTIGNLPPSDGLLKLLRLAESGAFWFDCYGGPESEEKRFRDRMVEIAVLSLNFWKNSAHLNYGIDLQSADVDFSEFECGTLAIFSDSKSKVPIFSIRYFHQFALVELIGDKLGSLQTTTHKVPGQVAPMIAVRVTRGA